MNTGRKQFLKIFIFFNLYVTKANLFFSLIAKLAV